LPAWVADKKRRAAKIRAAKAELEAEAKAACEAKAKAAEEEKRQAEGRRKPGKPAASPSPGPEAKAQKNFSPGLDPGSGEPDHEVEGRLRAGLQRPDRGRCAGAGDRGARCDAKRGRQRSAAGDGRRGGGQPRAQARAASADAGYCSEANLAGLEEREIDGYVATGRARDAVAGAAPEATPDAAAAQEEAAPADAATATGSAQEAKAPTRVEAMRAKIKSGGHASPYRLRKQVVEPVFGQIRQARGFRQFLLRGLEKVRGEWRWSAPPTTC
jgi:hypothetical protein